MIENLESRRLLTATYEVDGTVLRITGTANRDDLAFGLSPDGLHVDVNVFENGVLVTQESFPVGRFTLISARLGDGADTFIAGEIPVPVIVRGERGPDSLSGGAGNDTFSGGGGDDYIFGREGDDSITGGLQADLLLGGRNNDTIVAFSDLLTDDTIAGGQGTDTVDYSTVSDNVFVNVGTDLPDPAEDDRIFGDVEVLLGSAQNDTLINGTRRGMIIDGRAGADTLTGGSGNDMLIGGAGADSLLGKGGRDSLEAADSASDAIDGGRDSDTGTIDSGLDALFNLETTV